MQLGFVYVNVATLTSPARSSTFMCDNATGRRRVEGQKHPDRKNRSSHARSNPRLCIVTVVNVGIVNIMVMVIVVQHVAVASTIVADDSLG